MALTIKQQLLRYHIERREWVEEQIRLEGVKPEVCNALKESLAFHSEAVEFLSGGG